MWLHRLDDADASCGGKAVGLARLLRAGLPVPDGFVIDDRAFRHLVGDIDVTATTLEPRPHPIGFLPDPIGSSEPTSSLGHQLAEAAARIATGALPEDLVREVEARAAELGVLAVRSSATIEDGDAGAGAGVFSSRTAVPARDVWAAIRAVWSSALTPLAAAYARRRGGTISIGVILQRFVPGDLVTVYTRPPGEPARPELLVQRGETTRRIPRAEPATPSSDESVRTAASKPAAPTDERASTHAPGDAASRPAPAGAERTSTHAPGGVAMPTAGRVEGAAVRTTDDASVSAGASGPALAEGASTHKPGSAMPTAGRVEGAASGPATARASRSVDDAAVAALAVQAEVAIGSARGADVEIVESAGTRWIVQARPIVHPVTKTRRPPPPSVVAPLVADGRTWTWDVAHNPDPLSPAQAGLVDRVDRAQVSAWSLRVCAGFLYAARREEPAAQHVVAAPHNVAALDARVHDLELAMEAALTGPPPGPGAGHDAVRAVSEAPARVAVPGENTLALEDAIARYVAFYRIWSSELAPLIAAARMNLSPAQLAGARPSSVESTLFAAARGELDEHALLARIGVLSPAWDVSAATFGERPELVREAIERARAVLGEPNGAPATDHRGPGDGIAAIQPTESAAGTPRDPRSHSRTAIDPQRAVRKEPKDAPATDQPGPGDRSAATQPTESAAGPPHDPRTSADLGATVDPGGARETLHHQARAIADHADRDLARAAADLAERDDIWFARAQLLVRTAILARARDLAIDPDDAFWIPLDELAIAAALDPVDVRRRASAARTAATRAAQWAMPIVVGGEPLPTEPPLRGIGTGPRVTGRVVRFASLASAVTVGAGDVVVTRAVTPALAVLVIGCAALVSETGGLLDHGAALARELGIPCVVGCRDAWSLLADGMLVTVDGEAGEVSETPT